ncbi:MAG: hypothetical protein PSY14_06840 [bacterium]|nr:hypothetical protein [bacterium]
MTKLPPSLTDMAASLIEARRESMNANDTAIFDLMVMMELMRRGLAPADFYLELRSQAEVHRARAPYVAAIMKSIALHAAPHNVVSLPKPSPTGAKP